MVEIGLKWYCNFIGFWKSGWNLFDLIIVLSALLAPGKIRKVKIVILLMIAIAFISSSRILRLLRILRAFRTLKSIKFLEGIRSVAKTIIESIPGTTIVFSDYLILDMANIAILLGLIMFIYSVLGVTLFKKTAPEDFGDLPTGTRSYYRNSKVQQCFRYLS